MMKKILIAASVVLVLLAAGVLALIWRYGPNYGVYLKAPSPEEYGQNALSAMNAYGLYARGEAWQNAYAEARKALKGVSSYQDTRPILEKALSVAGGKHSFMAWNDEPLEGEDQTETPEDDEPEEEAEEEAIELPGVCMQGDVLVLTLPPFSGTAEEGQRYADVLAGALTGNGFSGVIVDLSQNTGGDMGPMLAGLSPLLPDGDVLFFEFQNGSAIPVTLKAGKVEGGGSPTAIQSGSAKVDCPVAVISGQNTGSSGEAMLLALKNCAVVKTFGQPSAGYASVNMTRRLYDGSSMMLTSALFKTPDGTVYPEEPIDPDVQAAEPYAPALEWLAQAAAQHK